VPVSVIVPAFNEARRLPQSLPALLAALRRIPGAELIVVDDGSSDDTAAIAAQLLRGVPDCQVIRLPWNSGKGVAVRTGVAAASGAAIVFMDADLSSDVGDLPLLLTALEHAEVALGSRRLGRGVDRSVSRRLGSWAFNHLTRALADLDLADTQCGFKAFRRDEAKILFSLARADGFGFDVEVLAIARAAGYRIVEVPVRWSEEPGGTFRVVRHTPAMVAEVVRARRYAQRVHVGTRARAGERTPRSSAHDGHAGRAPGRTAGERRGAELAASPRRQAPGDGASGPAVARAAPPAGPATTWNETSAD
jgi:glycosyltransferase involved in cell wall biosynthesis